MLALLPAGNENVALAGVGYDRALSVLTALVPAHTVISHNPRGLLSLTLTLANMMLRFLKCDYGVLAT